VAVELTFDDAFGSVGALATPDRPTGVRRRAVSAEHATHTHSAPVVYPLDVPACAAALELASDPLFIVDRSGVVQHANSACAALLDQDHPQLQGRHVSEILAVDARVMRAVVQGLRETAHWQAEVEVSIRGRRRRVQLGVRSVEETPSEVGAAPPAPEHRQQFAVVLRPLPEPAQAGNPGQGRRAREVFSALARVGSELAHNLNNQIAVVLNYSFILAREVPQASPEHTHVLELQRAAWQAAAIAKLLLQFGGKRSTEPMALDVQRVIRELQPTLALTAGRDAQIALDLSGIACVATARRSQLEWLLIDLVVRLRCRLQSLAVLTVRTLPALQPAGTTARDKSVVRIQLDAWAARPETEGSGAGAGPNTEAGLQSGQTGQAGEAGQGAPLDTERPGFTHYDVTLHELADGGLRYTVSLLVAG
jgi:nitrogen-specific signal transduction histidine kinase